MFIKDKVKNNDHINFVCMPVYDTHRLIKRARAIVDDYFTFINYERLSENYNFRKYCIEPVFDTQNEIKRLVAVKVTCLLFYNSEFVLLFNKTGEIKSYYPSDNTIDKQLFEDVIERTIKYVSLSE